MSVWRARGMPALLTTTVAGFSGFAVLLPVAPLWAVRGGADEAGSGLVNGVLLLFTVLTQLFVPGLLRRFGWGPVLATGLVLMGLPALAHLASDALAPTLVLSAVRGVGFGVLTVTGSAAVAELVDPARRGAAVGAYGLAIAGPQVVLLPLGPWVAEHVSYAVVFALGALPLLGTVPALALGRVLATRADTDAEGVAHARSATDPAAGSSAGEAAAAGPTTGGSGRSGRSSTRATTIVLLRPMTLLLGVTIAGGAVLTFTPQMLPGELAVALALALMGATAAVSRWRMGAVADRLGAERFLWPLVLVTVTSMVLLALAVDRGSTPLFLVSAALLGIAYGGLQNLTLVVAFSAVDRTRYGLASAVWNVGFDLGTGLGSVLVGALAVRLDFPGALLVTAALALVTLPLAVRRPRSGVPRRA